MKHFSSRSRHGCARRGRGRIAAVAPPQAAGLGAVAAVLIVGAAAGLYPLWSNWDWHALRRQQCQAARAPDVAAMVGKLEQHLRDQPDDLAGWLMLGRSYVAARTAWMTPSWPTSTPIGSRRMRMRPWDWARP